jgi:hypothetical protein
MAYPSDPPLYLMADPFPDMQGAELHLPKHCGRGEMICYRRMEVDGSKKFFGLKVRLFGSLVPIPPEADASGWITTDRLPYIDVPLSEREIRSILKTEEGFVLDSELSFL